MPCLSCDRELDGMAFCPACGHPTGKSTAFAVKPNESVSSLRLVSTIMPYGATRAPATYVWCLAIGLLAMLIASLTGAVGAAVLLAALAVPIVYVVYLYDVNQWEDQPLLVTGVAFVMTGALAGAWTIAWLALRGDTGHPDGLAGASLSLDGWGGPSLRLVEVLVPVLLVPVVGELVRQVAPVLLASRPQFDDLIDGLTFGVIAGVSYATADTLVKHGSLLAQGFTGIVDAPTWMSLLFLEGFVKPLVMGTATGLAGAEFSGLGRGHDGFTRRYWRRVVAAVLANALYAGGALVLLRWPGGVLGFVLCSLWGLVVLAILILRLRRALQLGLTEAALESAARRQGVGEGPLSHCEACEMPLLPGAAFCGGCGKALRATAKPRPGVEVTQ